MSNEQEPLQPFNLDTMSGVFPGTRTPVYQRVRLRAQAGATPQWFQLHWYSEPPGAELVARHPDHTPQLLARLSVSVDRHDLPAQLAQAVARHNMQLTVCGTCRHWQAAALQTDDALPLGRCRWRPAKADPLALPTDLPDELGLQSCLALDCEHFTYAVDSEDQDSSAPLPAAEPSPRPYVPKSAELDPDRLPFWQRQWYRLRAKAEGTSRPAANALHPIIERSGVGAGTEPCFVCQGRIANLGALVVESPEGDKQTLSVWRCRLCYTAYLNDWIDRWERLDSLETEERYYRIAPAEALAALTWIRGEEGGDHPVGRGRRHALRSRLLAIVANRAPLSHQVRQGR